MPIEIQLFRKKADDCGCGCNGAGGCGDGGAQLGGPPPGGGGCYWDSRKRQWIDIQTGKKCKPLNQLGYTTIGGDTNDFNTWTPGGHGTTPPTCQCYTGTAVIDANGNCTCVPINTDPDPLQYPLDCQPGFTPQLVNGVNQCVADNTAIVPSINPKPWDSSPFEIIPGGSPGPNLIPGTNAAPGAIAPGTGLGIIGTAADGSTTIFGIPVKYLAIGGAVIGGLYVASQHAKPAKAGATI